MYFKSRYILADLSLVRSPTAQVPAAQPPIAPPATLNQKEIALTTEFLILVPLRLEREVKVMVDSLC